MKSGIPWSIRGIDDETRAAARAAARQAGLSVSEWLHDLIAEKASEQGILPEAVDEDDADLAVVARVADLGARLHSLGDGSRSTAALRTRLEDIGRRLGELSRLRHGSREHADSLHDVAAMVDALSRDIDNADERARSMIEGLPGQAFAARMKADRDPPPGGVSDVIRDLDRKIAGMSGQGNQPRPPASFDELKLRLDELLAKAPPPPSAASSSSTSTSTSASTSAPASARRQPLDATLRSLEARIDAARARLVAGNRQEAELAGEPMRRIEERLAEIASHLDRQDGPVSRPQQRRGDDLASAIAQISARQRALDIPPDLLRAPDFSDAVATLRSDIAALADRAFAFGRGGAEDKGAFYELVRRIDALAAEKPVDRSILSAVRADLEAVRAVVDGGEQGPSLAARLDRLVERTPDAGRLDALGEEVSAMRRALEAADNPRAIARLEMRLAELGRNVEAALNADFNARRRHENDGIARFESTLNEIAARIDGLLDRATPGEAIAAIDQRIAGLAARLDEMDTFQRRPATALDEIKDELSDLRREMAVREPPRLDRLEDQMAALVGHLADIEAFQKRPLAVLDEVKAEVAALRREIGPQPMLPSDGNLEKQIAELARRLDTITSADVGDDALADLEAQVARLAGELGSAPPRSADLRRIEADLARLHGALVENRDQSLDAARQAARQAIDGLAASRVDNEILRALRDDLENVRRVAGSADQHARETVGSVHDALSTVADRLTRLEAGSTPGGDAREPESAEKRAASWSAADAGAGGPGLDIAALRELAGRSPNLPREAKTGDRKADFIAAARRAAQAAAAESALAAERDAPPARSGEGPFARIGKAIRSRRRPLLLAAAAIVLAIGTLQLFGERISGLGKAPAGDPLVTAVEAGQAEGAVASPGRPSPASAAAATVNQPALVAPTPGGGEAFAFAAPEAFDSRFGEASGSPPAHAFAAPSKPAGTRTASLGSVPAGALAEPASDEIDPAVGSARLREAAAAGEPGAAFEVAVRYAEGRGVAADLATASAWYRRAAEAGVAVAQYRLGSLYERGQGVEKDLAAAVVWYQRAADQGNVGAMHNLAVLMSEGIDGTPDHVKALQWFLTAADYGVKDSQYNLGVIYARGLGVAANLPEAYKWFSIAAAQGDTDAGTRRDEVAKAMTPDDLAKGRTLVQAWHPKPALPEANAVVSPDGGWDEPLGRVTEVDRRQLVTKIQSLLAEQGYDVGVADGVEGPKTREAVRAFQKTIGVAETGVISTDLVAALAPID